MQARSFIAQATAGAAVAGGPVLAAAEASGALGGTGRPLMVYVLSGGLTLVGSMFAALMWFVKREHASVIGGIAQCQISIHKLHSTTTALQLTVEQHIGELRTEVARRISVEDHSRSTSLLHEKVNALEKRVSFVRGKMGLGGDDV